MSAIETIGGHAFRALALQADALDFGADAATYAVTLWAIRRGQFCAPREVPSGAAMRVRLTGAR
jgi:Co/Zn/Cd efflux system component